MDWLDLLAVQGTLKSLRQHHSSKTSILWCSAFFIVQLSHPYMTTGKTIALTRWTFVEKVMSLLFNMLSRLVITFLPRNKGLLISWLQSPSAVIWSPQKIKSASWGSTKPLHIGFVWVKERPLKSGRCGHTNLYSLCLLKTCKFGSSGSSFLPISSRLVLTYCCCCCSIAVSDSLWPHGL